MKTELISLGQGELTAIFLSSTEDDVLVAPLNLGAAAKHDGFVGRTMSEAKFKKTSPEVVGRIFMLAPSKPFLNKMSSLENTVLIRYRRWIGEDR